MHGGRDAAIGLETFEGRGYRADSGCGDASSDHRLPQTESVMSSEPERWMHLRHAAGFDDARFAQFRSHCAILKAHAEALLVNWAVLFPDHRPGPQYEFGEPVRSTDHLVVSLPIAGSQTLLSRHLIEDLSSWMLWRHFPPAFIEGLEEGLTEGRMPANWRRPSQFIVLGKLPEGLRAALQDRVTDNVEY